MSFGDRDPKERIFALKPGADPKEFLGTSKVPRFIVTPEDMAKGMNLIINALQRDHGFFEAVYTLAKMLDAGYAQEARAKAARRRVAGNERFDEGRPSPWTSK